MFPKRSVNAVSGLIKESETRQSPPSDNQQPFPGNDIKAFGTKVKKTRKEENKNCTTGNIGSGNKPGTAPPAKTTATD